MGGAAAPISRSHGTIAARAAARRRWSAGVGLMVAFGGTARRDVVNGHGCTNAARPESERMKPVIVQSFASGSSGNALLLDAGDGPLLVDCGVGPRALAAGLSERGQRLPDIQAVLLTHEHADHVRALPSIYQARLPVVCTTGTARAARVPPPSWEAIRLGVPVRVGSHEVVALGVSHDAAEPCGFLIRTGAVSVLVVTDLGCADGALRDPIAEADLIVLEANHDEELLRRGPYPADLKRRVLSPVGHLSNAACGALLAAALARAPGPRTIWLAHLSQTNNRPELARATVQRQLAAAGLAHAALPLPRG